MYWGYAGNRLYWTRWIWLVGIDKYSWLVVLDMRLFVVVWLFFHRNDNPKNCRRYKILAVLEIFFNLTWTKFVENLEFIFEFCWFCFFLFWFCPPHRLAGTENKYTRLVFSIILRESDRILHTLGFKVFLKSHL